MTTERGDRNRVANVARRIRLMTAAIATAAAVTTGVLGVAVAKEIPGTTVAVPSTAGSASRMTSGSDGASTGTSGTSSSSSSSSSDDVASTGQATSVAPSSTTSPPTTTSGAS